MRGIESTVMRRVYKSDNNKIKNYIKILRIKNFKITGADVFRKIIEENIRQKKRINYLENLMAYDVKIINDMKRKINELNKSVYR